MSNTNPFDCIAAAALSLVISAVLMAAAILPANAMPV